MAKQSLGYSLSSLNPHLTSYDLFNDYLDKAYALVRVALSEEFTMCEKIVTYNYLSILVDLLLKLRQIFDEIWKQLSAIR